MEPEIRSCEQCSGCTGRHTDEQTMEEIKAGPYLVFAAAAIIGVSLLVKWLL